MERRSRSIAVLLTIMVALIVPGSAHATAGWQSGPLQETQGYNCITGDPEFLAGSFLSYYADPASPPKTGQVFYVSLSATGIGNTCAGIYAYPQLILPAGVSLAIDATHKVQCFLKFPNSNSFQQDTSSDCPQSLSTGLQGYNLTFVGGNGFWPLPAGGTIEMHIPVTASTAGALTFGSYIQTADGEGNGAMNPSLVAIVDSASTPVAQQIGIEYGNPSITNQVQSGGSTGAVNVSLLGFVDNHSNSGTAVVQLGQPPNGAGTDCTAPVSPTGIMTGFLTLGPVALATGSSNLNTQISGTFTNLYPAHNYCWRIQSTIAATTYSGNWEPFLTIGSHNSGDPTNATAVANPNCSGSTGNGCTTSTCSAGGTCGAASCGGSSCLDVFSPPATTPPATTTTTTPPPPPSTSTPSTSEPPPPPPPPTSRPTLSIHKASAALKGSIIVVATGLSISCPAGGASCPVTLTASISGAQAAKAKHKAKPLVVGSVRTSVAAGRTAAITFHLSSKARALLAKHHHLTISLAGSASTGAGGPKTTIARSISVSNPPKKHPHHR